MSEDDTLAEVMRLDPLIDAVLGWKAPPWQGVKVGSVEIRPETGDVAESIAVTLVNRSGFPRLVRCPSSWSIAKVQEALHRTARELDRRVLPGRRFER